MNSQDKSKSDGKQHATGKSLNEKTQPIQSTSPPEMKLTRSKRAGRPRLDGSGNAVLSDSRRSQIRRAQRTYREKKQAAFQKSITQAEQLQERMRAAVRHATELSEVAKEAQLHVSHPDIYERLKLLEGIVADDDEIMRLGSLIEPSPNDSENQVQLLSMNDQIPVQCALPPSLPTENHTYSFQEIGFARRLQRYCLEHTYRLFTDPNSDPRENHRVFRLFPCARDRCKTQPRFRQILQGSNSDPLEILSLPFYSIGGAGTHFPDLDEEGNAIYPVNSRPPRRILGILPWSDFDLEGDGALDTYGLGGEWFDSRDVEGYLRHHGVDTKSGLFPMVYRPGLAAGGGKSQLYTVDIEAFFSREYSIIS